MLSLSGHCVYTVSQNNPEVSDALRTETASEIFTKIMNDGDSSMQLLLLKNIVAGVNQSFTDFAWDLRLFGSVRRLAVNGRIQNWPEPLVRAGGGGVFGRSYAPEM